MQRLTFKLEKQPPLPFKAAEDYSATVLDWSSIPPAYAIAHRDLAYGPHRRHGYDVFTPPNAASAPHFLQVKVCTSKTVSVE